MPRAARIVHPGFPHHVVTRGNNRRRLFSYKGDYLRFLRLAGDALSKHDCVLHQVTLMVNHVHLVLTPASCEALSNWMKHVCQPYAQKRNQARKSSGKLFEQRFYSKAIETDAQLGATILYNDCNAFRAGVVAAPESHSWSTCALHCGASERGNALSGLWTPSVWYLALGSDPHERAMVYRRLLGEYLAEPRDRDNRVGLEEPSSARYRGRLERPDGSSAAELRQQYEQKSQVGCIALRF